MVSISTEMRRQFKRPKFDLTSPARKRNAMPPNAQANSDIKLFQCCSTCQLCKICTVRTFRNISHVFEHVVLGICEMSTELVIKVPARSTWSDLILMYVSNSEMLSKFLKDPRPITSLRCTRHAVCPFNWQSYLYCPCSQLLDFVHIYPLPANINCSFVFQNAMFYIVRRYLLQASIPVFFPVPY